ncbi:probable Ufm1-specific protease 2 [Drosophila grimshawi]|uniref:Probable Ufm1-specific protease 2 n=1 Tax=Drosophila grimshawi TaxID=7222 RepID=B4IWU7_DROGR|nr:probable Ufm1-specific protease 2 [Drosophila grimshawi]EDV97348.1 GH14744 [Drosophila grimshawi]
MLPKLRISAFLLKRLERVKLQCSGCLYGVFYGDGTLLLLSFNVEASVGQLNYEHIQHKFPAELDLCGLVKFGECSDTQAHLNEVISSVDITDNPILLQCQLGTLVGMKASFFMHGKLEDVPYEVMEASQLYNDFCFTRLKCGFFLYTAPTPEAIAKEMHALRKRVADGSLVFNVSETKIYVSSNFGTQHKSLNCDSRIEQLIAEIPTPEDTPSGNNKKKVTATASELVKHYGAVGCDYDVINIDVLRCRSREPPAGDAAPHPALSVCITNEETSKQQVPLELEAMAILCKKTKLLRLYDVLIESICRSLRLFEQCLSERLNEQEPTSELKLLAPRSYHFYPQEFGHFLSCAYLEQLSDDEPSVQEKRKRLHRQFALPVTRPYFRRANQCRFQCDIDASDASTWTPLLNTHLGVRPSGVIDGKEYLVNGNYHYYHYLQQQMQDKGWGCAYRSLQTICSWFLLQGYTERAIPTHLEIQEYLHKINDKPASFVGSSQWIGSTELSMCLQGFLNVDSKIQHVASGGELSTIASELAMHFQTQGTPVMIGGGVLAHTIIGVDYCVQTGQAKFLILDPHYTGADDLATIQIKGWCGWKGMDFWDKKSYYNLCMPQRPILY